MASTFSSDLKLELMATGENAGTWGTKTNTNLELLQQAIAGFEQVTLSSGGTLALAMSNASLSNARNMVIKFATASIAASTVCTVPDSIEKFYIFDATGLTNPTNLTIKTASGSGFTLDAAKIYAAYADGTNLKEVSLDTLGGTIGTAQIADDAVTSDKIGPGAVVSDGIGPGAVVAAGIGPGAVTAPKIGPGAVVEAGIGPEAVTAPKIGPEAVTAPKIGPGAVGATQLAATTVSAGTYTSATITVDADGRITSASSGAAGSPGFDIGGTTGLYKRGPASGQFSTNPNTTRIQLFIAGGGGGGRPDGPFTGNTGGRGGNAGYGYFNIATPGGLGPVAYTVGKAATEPSNAQASTFAHPSGTITANAGGNQPGFATINPNSGTQAVPSTLDGTIQSPSLTVGITFSNIYDFNAMAGVGGWDGPIQTGPNNTISTENVGGIGSVPQKFTRARSYYPGPGASTLSNLTIGGRFSCGTGILIIKENASD